MRVNEYLSFLYRIIIRLLSNLNYLVLRVFYKKPAKPYSLIYINPFDIEMSIESSKWVRRGVHYGSGFIKTGEWDRPKFKLPIKHKLLYECFKDVFINNVPAIETEYFKKIKSHSEKKNKMSLDLWYVKKYGPMFEDFSINSFKTPINIRDMSVDYFSIAIDGNGDLLFLTGKHRLALAKASGMQKIPVNVAIRHKKWQQLRDRLYTELQNGEVSIDEIKAMNHPDLLDLVCS